MGNSRKLNEKTFRRAVKNHIIKNQTYFKAELWVLANVDNILDWAGASLPQLVQAEAMPANIKHCNFPKFFTLFHRQK
jgi:hypothetical protein